MLRVPIHSRFGNVFLGILGAVYAISAFIVLVWFVIDVWRAAALLDRAMQLSLVAAAGCGVWLLSTAMENLGVRISRRAARGRQTAAATRP